MHIVIMAEMLNGAYARLVRRSLLRIADRRIAAMPVTSVRDLAGGNVHEKRA
jgi:hypothetical protein